MNIHRAKVILELLRMTHPNDIDLDIVWDSSMQCGCIVGHTVELAGLERTRCDEEWELAREWLELENGEDIVLFAPSTPELGLTAKQEAIQRLERMIAEEEEMTT